MFNIDGSEGIMCGNGVRCVAKFAVDQGLVAKDASSIRVGTGGGVRDIGILRDGDTVVGATVDMGEPSYEDADLHLDGIAGTFRFVSTGNPHAVTFVEDVAAIDLPRTGPLVANHDLFAGGINAHFAQILARDRVRVRHWERGSGPTLACGTGACATLVAGVVVGRLDRRATVEVPGGELLIRWDEATNRLPHDRPGRDRVRGSVVRVVQSQTACRWRTSSPRAM